VSQHVAIVIVGYRCAEEIRRCLETLAASTHGEFEVHVCENAGAEAFEALADKLTRSSVVSGFKTVAARSAAVAETRVAKLRPGGQAIALHRARANLGYAGGINAALESLEASGAWSAVWVLNPDTEVDPAALGALVAYAREGRYGIIGSRLVLVETGRIQLYGGRWRSWMARGFNIGLGAPADAEPDVAAIEQEMDYVSGAAMFVTRRYIDAIGRLDERYFLYCEEVDWCLRRGGFRLGYAHGSIVYHRHGATIGSSHDRRHESPLAVYLEHRNKLLLTRRFFPGRYPVAVVLTPVLASQYLLAGAFVNFSYALAGWLAGLRQHDGVPTWLGAAGPRRTAGAPAPDAADDTRARLAG
jgi:GT2 family glycosyltransferase